MLALTAHLASTEGAPSSIFLNAYFWPYAPYVVGALVPWAALLSELDAVASMGRRTYLTRPSGLLRVVLAAVVTTAFWQMSIHSEPIRASLDFEFLPIGPSEVGFLLAAITFTFAIDRGDRYTRAGVGGPGVSAGSVPGSSAVRPAQTTPTALEAEK